MDGWVDLALGCCPFAGVEPALVDILNLDQGREVYVESWVEGGDLEWKAGAQKLLGDARDDSLFENDFAGKIWG